MKSSTELSCSVAAFGYKVFALSMRIRMVM
jgi:hypothetical protein